MRDPYFHRLFETPADQGAAVDDAPVDDTPDGGGPIEEAPEPTRYTMDEIAEHLGPRFAERYAGKHEGAEALKQYGSSFESTIGLVGRGAHLSPQDPSIYEQLGIEAPAEPEEVDEPAMPLYGAPWAEPTSWDELVGLAERNPRAAAEFALNRDDLPNETKAWFFANWASVDAAGAFEYNQAATTAAAQKYADEQVAAIRAQVDPLVHDRMVSNADLMLSKAQETIPGFAENGNAIQALMRERAARDPRYHEWFLNSPLKTQLDEMRDLTGIVVFRNQPAADAAAAEALAATEAEKARAKTETTAGGGTRGGGGAQSEAKKRSLADFQKLKDQGVI